LTLAQGFDKLLAAEEFQSWKLKVNTDRPATLTCEDGDGGTVFTKAIEFTDATPCPLQTQPFLCNFHSRSLPFSIPFRVAHQGNLCRDLY
jgi:hypothetical protein